MAWFARKVGIGLRTAIAAHSTGVIKELEAFAAIIALARLCHDDGCSLLSCNDDPEEKKTVENGCGCENLWALTNFAWRHHAGEQTHCRWRDGGEGRGRIGEQDGDRSRNGVSSIHSG